MEMVLSLVYLIIIFESLNGGTCHTLGLKRMADLCWSTLIICFGILDGHSLSYGRRHRAHLLLHPWKPKAQPLIIATPILCPVLPEDLLHIFLNKIEQDLGINHEILIL